MRAWSHRGVLRGRIHGRLLLVLVAVAAIASAAAVWQFGSLRDDHDPDLAEAQLPAGPQFTGAGESATPSPSASPSETPPSSAAPTSAEPTTAEAETSEADPAETVPPCTASLRLDSESDDSVSVTVEVANTGTEPIDGWEVVLDLKHLEVTTTWGLQHIDGDRYGDILFNAAIEPGDSVEPSFQADTQGAWELPATVPCTPAG
ncbi:cellulose binding domain-containing protein [Glycomyces terrestris]|uniref:CBM2 domain-containing protein n=1 Tax=Glycomyces terrestris TaxID=2493553 RepID=A0A426V0U0_9ACTN|nr:cellulose binding domain-containing protein [Glycomyces terrestris]RRS00470.1 hypothetical protein EIW28_07870 [Glycomyces terrestris]